MLVGFGLFLLVGATLIKLLYAVLSQNLNANPTSEDIRNLGLAAGAMIGIPFLIWRSIVAQKQVDVSEQGHITDRINKAVEGLGAEKSVKRDGEDETEPNLEVRIGALYALERISQYSARDHIQAMEILCAYIRNNADRHSPRLPEEEPKEGWQAWGLRNRTHPPLDVDIALRIIERRSNDRKQREKDANYRLGLERAPFHALELHRRDLTDAILTQAKLQGTILWDTKLQGADLGFAKLHGAILGEAKLQGANLRSAKLQGANLIDAELQGADLIGAKLQGADLWGAEFDKSSKTQAANFTGSACVRVDFTDSIITKEQLQTMFGDGSTTLPGGGGPDHPDWHTHWPKEMLKWNDFQTAWRAWQAKIGFQPPKNP
jgi:hypothetical protein